MPSQQPVRIGLGGGCHWYTEDVFSSLHGIRSAQQGWSASTPPKELYIKRMY